MRPRGSVSRRARTRTAIVYVLGAGASYVHGAPLTDDLLRYALSIRPVRRETALVRRFLEQVFHFAAPATLNNRGWTQVPSLVDILSIVDVALDRKERPGAGLRPATPA